MEVGRIQRQKTTHPIICQEQTLSRDLRPQKHGRIRTSLLLPLGKILGQSHTLDTCRRLARMSLTSLHARPLTELRRRRRRRRLHLHRCRAACHERSLRRGHEIRGVLLGWRTVELAALRRRGCGCCVEEGVYPASAAAAERWERHLSWYAAASLRDGHGCVCTGAAGRAKAGWWFRGEDAGAVGGDDVVSSQMGEESFFEAANSCTRAGEEYVIPEALANAG